MLKILLVLVIPATIAVGNDFHLTDCCPENSTLQKSDFSCKSHLKDKVVPYNINCDNHFVIEYDRKDIETIEYCYLIDAKDTNKIMIAVCPEYEPTPIYVYLFPISLICLILTFAIYYNIKTLRAPEDIAFMISVLCLSTYFLFSIMYFALIHVTDIYDIIFFFYVYIAHFAAIAYFAWLNVIMANQLKKFM